MKTWRWYLFRKVGLVVLMSTFVLFYGNWLAQRQQIHQQFNQIEQQMNHCQLVAEQSKIDETTIEELVQWYDGMMNIYYHLNRPSYFLQSFTEKQDQKRFEKNMQAFLTYTKTHQQPLVQSVKKSIGMKEGSVSFGEYKLYHFMIGFE